MGNAFTLPTRCMRLLHFSDMREAVEVEVLRERKFGPGGLSARTRRARLPLESDFQ
jgi:hypothetical protein